MIQITDELRTKLFELLHRFREQAFFSDGQGYRGLTYLEYSDLSCLMAELAEAVASTDATSEPNIFTDAIAITKAGVEEQITKEAWRQLRADLITVRSVLNTVYHERPEELALEARKTVLLDASDKLTKHIDALAEALEIPENEDATVQELDIMVRRDSPQILELQKTLMQKDAEIKQLKEEHDLDLLEIERLSSCITRLTAEARV